MPEKRKKLVIVESPTKAGTISKFLGKDYTVESCMGHIRDLPESAKYIPEEYKKEPWSALGVNVEDGFQPIYCIPSSKKDVVRNLKSKIKTAGELILATDEDREGESISWHLTEILKPKIPVKRMVFHEITKGAIEEALQNFRQINPRLVKAQEARRVLDRLVGYTISPLLWKKILGGLSAGRVQSLAVKLISDREMERIEFQKAAYHSLQADLLNKKKQVFSARLRAVKNKQIAEGKDFDEKGRIKNKRLLHLKEKEAGALVKFLTGKPFIVSKLEETPRSRSPAPPFITSTLQQAGSRQLNLSARQTMMTAQKLYEKGWITYMRTDSLTLSASALKSARQAIKKLYGSKEVPEKPRFYKTKSKGAQEAHEAIRPAGSVFKTPEETRLKGEELALYRLIWKRTLASQMKNCEQLSLSVSLTCENTLWAASGTTVKSPGFYRLYQAGRERDETPLPSLAQGEELKCKKLSPGSHETAPPPRYNEASLIQKLEKEGVGRPSTYAPIISTIQNRGYVQKADKALAPTFTALVVTNFLKQHFPNYVNIKFTSDMEKTLDDIAGGKTNHTKYLATIYKGKKGLKNQVEKQETSLNGKDSRTLILKPFKGIRFHVGRFGAYISRPGKNGEIKVSLPKDTFPSDLSCEKITDLIQAKKTENKSFGTHPKTKEKIFIKTGRYGPYLEMEESKKRSSIPAFLSPGELTLPQAVQLLELPKILGKHPETKKEIKKSIGKYGPYIVHDGDFRSVPADTGFLTLSLKKALSILARPKKGRKRVARKVKPLREFQNDGEAVQIFSGRYGPYLKFQNKNISLPAGFEPETLTLKSALEIIKKKAGKKTAGRFAEKKRKTSARQKGKNLKKTASDKKTVARKKPASPLKRKKPVKKSGSRQKKR